MWQSVLELVLEPMRWPLHHSQLNYTFLRMFKPPNPGLNDHDVAGGPHGCQMVVLVEGFSPQGLNPRSSHVFSVVAQAQLAQSTLICKATSFDFRHSHVRALLIKGRSPAHGHQIKYIQVKQLPWC